ncbi:MAG: AAA domain-containing protein [Acidimicrobiales bacterium]
MVSPSSILRYLAALAPAQQESTEATLDAVARPGDFAWLGDVDLHDRRGDPPPPDLFDRSTVRRAVDSTLEIARGLTAEYGDYGYRYALAPAVRAEGLARLSAIDWLDPHQQALRIGWLWLCGRRRDAKGAPQPVLLPAVSRVVRLHEAPGDGKFQPEWRSDPEIHPFLAEWMEAADQERLLESYLRYDTAPVLAGCRTLGMTQLPEVVERGRSPLEHAAAIARRSRHEDDVLYLGVGAAVYATGGHAPTTVAGGISRWANERVERTAFARVYGLHPDERNDDQGDDGEEPSLDADAAYEPLESPLPVNARQREALQRCRTDPVSVISGPPGTGKTHTVAAAAIDAVAAGQSVLIATQSDHAAESVCELLERHPSVPYLRFGRAEHRQRIADRLSAGRHQAPTGGQVDEAAAAEARARERMTALRDSIHAALRREAAFSDGLRRRDTLAVLTADAPGVLAPDLDLVAAHELLDAAGRPGGWFRRRRASRAERSLRSLVRARREVDLAGIARALEVAQAERDVDHALSTGGTSLDSLWDELDAADGAWRSALAELVDVRRRHTGRLQRRRARSSVAALATVLRTGVGRRTSLLSDIETDDFLDLLPLWIGTLDEIERTLPVIAGLFDLVIIDEASQVDLLRSAGALCRAERVMVVGDPQQLRHVSFIADADVDRCLDEAGVDDSSLRRLLDVRRNSLFDVGASAASVVWLDEHFRSVPHLIDFSARTFYDDELRLMTQHPSVEGHDAITQIRVDGTRVDGVNQSEIDRVLELVADLAYRPGTGSIGVLTPFRAQADAMQAAIVERFSVAQIRQFGLRTGTVHAFQGSERDTVVISLALDDEGLGRSLRFVEDPNLFNVMVTRARRHIVLLHSFEPAALPSGLLAQYFRFADDPPEYVERRSDASPWVRQVADALGGTDMRVVTEYPVAGWTIDIALGNGAEAIGVECTVHPDGPDAHIERHLTLRRAGWTMTDAFQSRWLLRPEEVAAHLAARVQRSVDRHSES